MVIPKDYVERCYAGWLGKLIGVRFGAPIEGWSYEQIRKVYGVLTGYVDTYSEYFAADDDTNVPLALLAALYDYTCTSEITPEQIGLTLLNYSPYEHGFFWWGGYGRSTEHTAYTNLREGIPAPWSGSVEHNGAAVAEQIGGQIFIDTWGLIAPGNPKMAAEYAAKAASVTHGGNGIYGGMFIAAAIATAFTENSIDKIIHSALGVIPTDCEYAIMVKDICGFFNRDIGKNWENAFRHVVNNWGYDRYPGNCHIIPNAAVIILSLLYGGGDFSRTLCICNMCGWDTDCNAGNVGTIMGTLVGLNGIEKHWRNRVNDAFALSTVLGCNNYLDAPWCAAFISNLGYQIAKEEIPERWKPFLKTYGFYCHFEFPGSTHGFKAYAENKKPVSGIDISVAQTTDEAASGTGSLKIAVRGLNRNDYFRAARRTHFRPEDFFDSRYDPSFSPIVYPGQKISIQAKAGRGGLYAALYAFDANSAAILAGKQELLSQDNWTALSFTVPAGSGMCIDEIGVRACTEAAGDGAILLYLDDLSVDGQADYSIDFTKERNEKWSWVHQEVSQFSKLRGVWAIEDGKLIGTGAAFAEAYTGHAKWSDMDFSAGVTPLYMRKNSRVGIGFRVQGAMRSYCAALQDGMLVLLKNQNGLYHTLAETPFSSAEGKTVSLRAVCRNNSIQIYADGSLLISYCDYDAPYLTGCIGAILLGGARAAYDNFLIKAR